MPLLAGSPALGAGVGADYPGTTTPITTDQRGFSVPATPDIGAFQSQGFTLTPSPTTPQSAPINTSFGSLAVTLAALDPNVPVSGAVITFLAGTGGTGTSASLSSPAASDAGGSTSVTATANGNAGSYTVTASILGASPTTFDLTNAPAARRSPSPRRRHRSPSSPTRRSTSTPRVALRQPGAVQLRPQQHRPRLHQRRHPDRDRGRRPGPRRQPGRRRQLHCCAAGPADSGGQQGPPDDHLHPTDVTDHLRPQRTVNLSATGGGSGNPVLFSIDPSSTGLGSISGATLTLTGAGGPGP